MTTLGLILVCLSACCHASWNLLSKLSGGPISFLQRALKYSTLCYLPLFLVAQPWAAYSTQTLLCLLSSGVATGLFLLCLSLAYHHGQVSVAYPIARSFPILVVTWVAWLWGRFPSPTALIGIVCIVGGCFLLPMERLERGPRGFALRNYANASCFWAFLAALLTSIFSIIDKVAATAFPAEPASVALISRVNYVYLQNAIAWGVMAAVSSWRAWPRQPTRRGPVIAAGLILLISYSLIILALTTDPVAYVVSFRQLSILITALISMIWIERQVPRVRLVSIGVIFAGVVLVGLAD